MANKDIFLIVFPVSVSGMITLPVTAQMYHSLVQQQMPGSENTVCVTPMQVQNFIANSSLCGSLVSNPSMTNTNYQIFTTAANQNHKSILTIPLTSHLVKSSINNFESKSAVSAPAKNQFLKKKILKFSTVSKLKKPIKLNESSKVIKNAHKINNNLECVRNQNEHKNFSKCVKKIKFKPKIDPKAKETRASKKE